MKKPSIKGTETEKNLMQAFALESQSVTRYKLFSKQAKKDDLPQIAGVFKATAKNKLQHAKVFLSLMEAGRVEITAAYQAGPIETTVTNLAQAAANEHEKWDELYPEFAKVAQEEGFVHIATIFHHVMAVDKMQEELFTVLSGDVLKKRLYSSAEDQVWTCRVCGHHHTGKTPPEECPLCGSPMKFFQRKA